MGLVKQVKMQLQLWPYTLEEASFSVLFSCDIGKNILSLSPLEREFLGM